MWGLQFYNWFLLQNCFGFLFWTCSWVPLEKPLQKEKSKCIKHLYINPPSTNTYRVLNRKKKDRNIRHTIHKLHKYNIINEAKCNCMSVNILTEC